MEKKNKYGASISSPKKSILTNKLGALFGTTAEDFGDYLLHQKIIPAAKDMAFDAITNMLSMLIFKKPVSKSKSIFGAASYKDFFGGNDSWTIDISQSSKSTPWSRSTGKSWDFSEIVFPTEQAAVSFLEYLENIIDACGSVSIMTMYSELDISRPFTDDNYGWFNLSQARTVRTRNGWIIDFPPVKFIRR